MDEFDEIQYLPSIDFPEVQQIEGEENWMTLIVSYLKDRKLLEGKDKTRKLRVRSARYILMDEVLYKRGFSQPYLRCDQLSVQDTIGQLSKLMPRHMSRSVINVNNSVMSIDNPWSILPQ